MKMVCPTKTPLLLGLVSFAMAEIFDNSFLIRLEDITNTNRVLTETNRNLSETNKELR